MRSICRWTPSGALLLTALSGEAGCLSRQEPQEVTEARADVAALRPPVCGPSCDARCVSPFTPYLVTEGYVVDTSARGRLWQRRPSAAKMTLAQAATYCAKLYLGRVFDWRLPTVEELSSILYKAGGLHAGSAEACSPAIDQAAFPDTPAEFFWTSEQAYVNFFDGRSHRVPIDETMYVRCVHDP